MLILVDSWGIGMNIPKQESRYTCAKPISGEADMRIVTTQAGTITIILMIH
jgi:hypothetical protein